MNHGGRKDGGQTQAVVQLGHHAPAVRDDCVELADNTAGVPAELPVAAKADKVERHAAGAAAGQFQLEILESRHGDESAEEEVNLSELFSAV